MNLQVIYIKTAFIKTNSSNYIPRNRNNNRKWNSSNGFLHHKLRIQKSCRKKDSFINKEIFYELYFQNNAEIYKTIIKESTKLGHYNLISLLWLISNLRKGKHQKRKNTTKLQDRRSRKSSSKRNNHILSKDKNHPHSNICTNKEMT